jgi:putative transposase
MRQAQEKELYPCCLSDAQWDLIRWEIPSASGGGRPRTTDVRQVINGIFYLVRSGCAWRYLPKEFPPWQTIYGYLSRWQSQEVWIRIHDRLKQLARLEAEKKPHPSAAMIDSQSVRAAFGENRGYDGYKRLQGRKRHVLVDTLGLVLARKVHEANGHDGTFGQRLLKQSPQLFEQRDCEALYADAAYLGDFELTCLECLKIRPTIRAPAKSGSKNWKNVRKRKGQGEGRTLRKEHLKPKRWIVERTFAWFNHYRRLSRDYEKICSRSETMLDLVMIQLLVRRLRPAGDNPWKSNARHF